MARRCNPRPLRSYGVLLVLSAGLVRAQCPEAILDPGLPIRTTPGSPPAYEDFLALVEALYAAPPPDGATKLLMLDELAHQVPPWFEKSTECTEALLRDRSENLPSTFADHLLDGDDLSELMIVTALATNDERMLALDRTVQKLNAGSDLCQQNQSCNIPCYRARVQTNPPSITCFLGDSASDITARVALAYYYAANNPAFPCSSRALYRDRADQMALAHLDAEYVNLNEAEGECLTSAITNQLLCHWIANGAGSAKNELMSELVMLIGYHQDIVRMLLAAYHSTGNEEFLERAEAVVHQWLIASEFTELGDPLRVGRKQFKWDTSTGTPFPVKDPGDDYHWLPGNPPWDDLDAPRALWMGDALRSLLLTGTASRSTLPTAYSVLRDWVERIQAADGQEVDASCVQLNLDGTCFANAGTHWWVIGLGTGLHTEVNTGELDDKLAPVLKRFWENGMKWEPGHTCFGIYQGVRPVKALASAIGLDAVAYGSEVCGRDYFTVTPCRLLDTRTEGGSLAPNETRLVQVAGKCGIPKSARALSLNVTVVQPATDGHVSLGSDPCALSATSNLNFATGRTRANNAIVRLSREGYQRLFAQAAIPAGGLHLVIDVNGYFSD